jgi:N-acetyl-anhydromuramyl-L-alanine amidase AmpD
VPDKGNTVYKIVSEDRRAQHAGTSLWKNRKNVNVISIGIEVVNLGFKCKNNKKYCKQGELDWIGFSEKQQKLIVSLAKDIQKRYNIDPLCIVGHSDIAVDRKLDPGPLFPWKMLADNGVGAWATDEEIQIQTENIKKSLKGNISPLLLQIRLFEFGYDIRLDKISVKSLTNKLLRYEYNLNKTRISDLEALQLANNFGNKGVKNDMFDIKKTNFAIHSFLMHYLPVEYLNHRVKESNSIADNPL